RKLLLLAAADALLGALDHGVEELVGLGGITREPMVEGIAGRVLDDAGRLGGRQPVLGLALEFRLADEYRDHAGGAGHHVFAGHRRRALALAHALRGVLAALQPRAAPPRRGRARGPRPGVGAIARQS